VKVSTEGGDIAIGDQIAISSVAGVGKKAAAGEESVGTALQPFTSASGPDGSKILIFTHLGYAKLDPAVTESGGQATTNAWNIDQVSGKVNVNFFGSLNLQGNDILDVGRITGMS